MSLTLLRSFSKTATSSTIRLSLIAHCYNANTNFQQLAKLGERSTPAKKRYTAELVKKDLLKRDIKELYKSINTNQLKIRHLEKLVIDQDRKIKQTMIDYYDDV
jgi:hypothetical protein|tara:strand:+ start:72 stop:383 length:312 start_codon:yes stop_codon:yes gene_type:complete